MSSSTTCHVDEASMRESSTMNFRKSRVSTIRPDSTGDNATASSVKYSKYDGKVQAFVTPQPCYDDNATSRLPSSQAPQYDEATPVETLKTELPSCNENALSIQKSSNASQLANQYSTSVETFEIQPPKYEENVISLQNSPRPPPYTEIDKPMEKKPKSSTFLSENKK